MTSNGEPRTDQDRTVDQEESLSNQELAQAFSEIAQGERTAAALESQLNSIEQKIEELLARADQDQKALEQQEQEEENAAYYVCRHAQATKINSK